MTRSQHTFAVYRELRRTIGAGFSPRQLMTCAASLVELFFGSNDEPDFELRTGGVPYCDWPVDRALADGGWRLLALESQDAVELDEDHLDRVEMRGLLSRVEMEVFA